MNNVLPIQNQNRKVIPVDDGDAKNAGDAAKAVASWHQALGEEEERHQRVKAEILSKLGEARRELQSTVTGLMKKYIQEKGKYYFNPEIGAFIGDQQQPQLGEPPKEEKLT